MALIIFITVLGVASRYFNPQIIIMIHLCASKQFYCTTVKCDFPLERASIIFFTISNQFQMRLLVYVAMLLVLSWGAVHKVRHAIFGQFLPPPLPVTLCHTSRDPRKYVTYLGTPRFLVGLVQKTQIKAPCTNSLSIVRGGFIRGFFVRKSFVWKVLSSVVFIRSPFCQNTSVIIET